MRISLIQLSSTALCALLLSASLPLSAQEIASRPQAGRFSLSATVNSLPPQAVPQAVAPNFARIPEPQVQAQSPQPDNGYLSEYNVDWSGWISHQADRWYYNLKSTETMFGLGFVTERPALIQFTCYANGTIGNIVLKQSSGAPIYDRIQIETLLATVPLNPFPAGTKRSSITLSQGWESHPKQPGEIDYRIGSFGKNFPKERVRQWVPGQ